jgi:hypothetical protein
MKYNQLRNNYCLKTKLKNRIFLNKVILYDRSEILTVF